MSERNDLICQRYVAGATLQEVGRAFHISNERVRQILRKAGVFKTDRRKEVSDRDVFLGVNVSEADKVALRAEAERRGMSMSMLTSDLIKEMLTKVTQSQKVV